MVKKKTQKKIQKKTQKKTRTYIIKSAYLKSDKIKNILKQSKNINWEEFKNLKKSNKSTKKNINSVDWIHTDEKFTYDKTLWGIKSKLKSQVDLGEKTITNKFNLINELQSFENKKLNQMLLEQYKINLFTLFNNKKNLINNIIKYQKLFKNNKVWIFKPIFGHEGKDIIIVKSFDHFIKIIQNKLNNKTNQQKWKKLNYKKYQKMRNLAKFSLNIEWVIQEYISNPLLYKNKKFHLRGYFLYHRLSNTQKKGYLFENHRVFTAKLPYKNDDYYNKDIHDTHIASTPKELNYNPDITSTLSKIQEKDIQNQLNYLFKYIQKVIKAQCYPENKHCYHLFASDIMITQDYKIKLIEMNTRPGMGEYNKQKVDYPHLIFKKIMDNIVLKHF